jgi:predicted enzyme related to lactoylglutathione lyase
MAIATSITTMLDCPDPIALANFYAEITGTAIVHVVEKNDHPQWVMIGEDNRALLAFQRVENHVAPTWPDGPVPQQMHLDIDVEDLDEAEAVVLALGAVKSPIQTSSDPQTNYRVFFDPAGHPFCLVSP